MIAQERSAGLIMRISERVMMKFKKLRFGSITINGTAYDHGVIIECGKIRKLRKRPSKTHREQYGHTPISVEEKNPGKCRRLVMGTGNYGSLPVMDGVKREARRRRINLAI